MKPKTRERFNDIYGKTSKEEKNKHINWCSRHQRRHCVFPMYWSCDYPNRKKKKCEYCEGKGWYARPNFNTGDPEQVQCDYCEGKKIVYLPN